MRMKEKIAIITGGSDGIGKETALLFGREGATVVIADYDAEKGKEVINQLKKVYIESLFIKTDVRESIQVQEMVEQIVKQYGRIDVLINNAGVAGVVPVTELSEEDWDRVVDTNLKGVFLCCKYAIPYMIKNGGGVIVNMGSVLGFVGRLRASAYNASKAGVIMLTKNMALDYVDFNIRVNAICPGYVETEIVRRYIKGCEEPEKTYRELVNLHPMDRLGRPEEIANGILFLASSESSFMTGSCLVMDGGYSCQ
ncbi:MAG: glucose 1-dehydrogenase [Deltaproteobacteria bacterium]|nr:glucose 1-dehydrogenase [Deltaproteobacteria bacterium]MBW2333514.1 glucose 1-dehydrogenase [Deltaproteobacteria bacterium]